MRTTHLMYLYTFSELSEHISEKAKNHALLEFERENDGESKSRERIAEAIEWHVNANISLLNQIFDQFKWRSIKNPIADGEPVKEWRHEICNDISASSFNGLIGHRFLSVNNDSLEVYLNWYCDSKEDYQQSEILERWVVDMLIYCECRMIALESTGRLKNGALNSLPFFLFGRRRKLKAKLEELLPKAVASYQCLDPISVDWCRTEQVLNVAYNSGVEWRSPLPNFVSRLASRQSNSIRREADFAETT